MIWLCLFSCPLIQCSIFVFHFFVPIVLIFCRLFLSSSSHSLLLLSFRRLSRSIHFHKTFVICYFLVVFYHQFSSAVSFYPICCLFLCTSFLFFPSCHSHICCRFVASFFRCTSYYFQYCRCLSRFCRVCFIIIPTCLRSLYYSRLLVFCPSYDFTAVYFTFVIPFLVISLSSFTYMFPFLLFIVVSLFNVLFCFFQSCQLYRRLNRIHVSAVWDVINGGYFICIYINIIFVVCNIENKQKKKGLKFERFTTGMTARMKILDQVNLILYKIRSV